VVYVQLKADRTDVVSKRLSVPLSVGSTDKYTFNTVRVGLEQFGGGEWNQVSRFFTRFRPIHSF
jgi:hypothetical protein